MRVSAFYFKLFIAMSSNLKGEIITIWQFRKVHGKTNDVLFNVLIWKGIVFFFLWCTPGSITQLARCASNICFALRMQVISGEIKNRRIKTESSYVEKNEFLIVLKFYMLFFSCRKIFTLLIKKGKCSEGNELRLSCKTFQRHKLFPRKLIITYSNNKSCKAIIYHEVTV